MDNRGRPLVGERGKQRINQQSVGQQLRADDGPPVQLFPRPPADEPSRGEADRKGRAAGKRRGVEHREGDLPLLDSMILQHRQEDIRRQAKGYRIKNWMVHLK